MRKEVIQYYFLTLFSYFRTSKYLKGATLTRSCAIGGFFVSIPLFLIGKLLLQMRPTIWFCLMSIPDVMKVRYPKENGGFACNAFDWQQAQNQMSFPNDINMTGVQQTQIVFNNIWIISSNFFFKALHICQRQFLSKF